MFFINSVYKKIKKRNSIWKFKIIKPYLEERDKVLDFGCGDLGLSNEIVKNYKNIDVVGVDVITLPKTFKKNKKVSFIKYDGEKLPFKDNEFGTTIAFYVLHHCNKPENIIKECIRVTKKKLIVVESIPMKKYELPFMKFFDWFFNIMKFDMTPLPYKFYTLKKWKQIFAKYQMKNVNSYHPKNYEDYFPFGKMYILEFRKAN